MGGASSADDFRSPVDNFNQGKNTNKTKKRKERRLKFGTWNIQGCNTKDKEKDWCGTVIYLSLIHIYIELSLAVL